LGPWLSQVFRATGGKALVWGKPPKKIVAKYGTGDGKQKTSLLLASGEDCLLPMLSLLEASCPFTYLQCRACALVSIMPSSGCGASFNGHY
jgi:hypothetical protein